MDRSNRSNDDDSSFDHHPETENDSGSDSMVPTSPLPQESSFEFFESGPESPEAEFSLYNSSDTQHNTAGPEYLQWLADTESPCPVCSGSFNQSDRRPAKDCCGHIMCKLCFDHAGTAGECPSCIKNKELAAAGQLQAAEACIIINN